MLENQKQSPSATESFLLENQLPQRIRISWSSTKLARSTTSRSNLQLKDIRVLDIASAPTLVDLAVFKLVWWLKNPTDGALGTARRHGCCP
jgi:hypothetical protein